MDLSFGAHAAHYPALGSTYVSGCTWYPRMLDYTWTFVSRGAAIRYCVQLGTSHLRDHPVEHLMELARVADEAGVDSLWVPEAPFYWDAFAILGSLARVTQQVRLGTGVTSPYVRPPHLQAMSVATLDRLSGGRAFLGVGRSLHQWYERLLGVDVGDPVEVMEETISLLRQWWEPPFTASSQGYFHVQGLRRYTGGVQPHLPIYLAAVGPRMLRVAARLADGVVFFWPSLDFLRQTIPHMRSEAASAGRPSESFAYIVYTGLEVTEEPEAALERFKSQMAVYHSIPGMEHALITTGYDARAVMAEVRRAMRTSEILANGGWTEDFRRMSDFDAAARAIPTGLVGEVAIVGDVDGVRGRLTEYQAAGVTHIFVPHPAEKSAEAYADFLASIQPGP